MADDLNDEWWNHDTTCEEGGDKPEKGSKAVVTKKRECSDEDPPAKQKSKRKRRRITDVELKQTGFSAHDFCQALEEHYKGKLSVVEREAMSMKSCAFGPSNPDMSHTVPSILKEALPKWQRLCSAHDTKKSPLAIVISQGAVRALHLNKEASTFKGEKCKTVKLFARHMKQESQAKFLASNVTHFAIATPARLASLIAEGSLSLKHTKLVMLDWNWRNVKLKRMVDIPDIKKSLFDLLKNSIIPACKSDHVKIAIF